MIRDGDQPRAYEPTPPGPRACARALGGADRAQARSAEHGPGVGIGFSSAFSFSSDTSANGKGDVLVTDKARDLFVEGNALFKKGDYGRARAAYLAAFALKRHWQIAGNLGDCEMKLGMFRDAAEHLAFAVREAGKEGESTEAHRKVLELAKAKVGALAVSVSEAGAEV